MATAARVHEAAVACDGARLLRARTVAKPHGSCGAFGRHRRHRFVDTPATRFERASNDDDIVVFEMSRPERECRARNAGGST